MKAVILAAGEGKRMHPLTLERPKPLVQVSGKPLIEHIWDSLPAVVAEVVLVVGYKEGMLRDFLGSEFKGRRITYITQDRPLGTGHALMLCREQLEHEDKFLIMYADDLQGRESIEECLKHPSALMVSFVDDPRRFGVITANEDGTVGGIEEKPEHPRSNLAATGVYVLKPEIFTYEPTKMHNDEYYLTHMIERYVYDHPTHIVESNFWLPIAYPHDIIRAEEVTSLT